MESELAAALTDAERSRDRLARDVVVPSWFTTSIGVAIALQIAAAAVGLGNERVGLVFAGCVPFVVVAGVQLRRFRARNGVWLGGLASRVVFGTSSAASGTYAVALGFAIWAGYEGQWPAVAVCAIAGGVGYAVSGRSWIRRYRAEPAAHARGESALMLAALGLLAAAGAVLLLVNA